MDYLYFVPIISFLGIFAGVLLKKIAHEEVKFGKFGSKYFIWMKRLILISLILINLLLIKNYLYLVLGVILGFILGIFISEYFFLSLTLIIGFMTNNELLLANSSLVFLYGFPYGSIIRRIRPKQIIIVLISFLVPFILLFFNLNSSFIIGVLSGGIFQYIIRK